MLVCQFLVAIIGVTVGFNNATTLADGTILANNVPAVNAQIAFIAIFIVSTVASAQSGNADWQM